MRINSSGNVGIGTTIPTASSNSSYKQFFVSTGGALVDSGGSGPATMLLNNSYIGSGNNNYATATQKAARILMTSGRIDFATADSVSADAQQTFNERMRINNNGVVSVPSGIALGVGTASTASNVLDDYEEGTWTPVVNTAGGFSTGATNYTGTSAPRYTKIGNRVFLQCQVQMGNSTGNVALDDSITMTGLPFTPADIERNTVTEYRYNTNVAYMTSYLTSSGSILSKVRFIKGTPLRNGGSINININYTV